MWINFGFVGSEFLVLNFCVCGITISEFGIREFLDLYVLLLIFLRTPQSVFYYHSFDTYKNFNFATFFSNKIFKQISFIQLKIHLYSALPRYVWNIYCPSELSLKTLYLQNVFEIWEIPDTEKFQNFISLWNVKNYLCNLKCVWNGKTCTLRWWIYFSEKVASFMFSILKTFGKE